jgi:hypothetical protein
MKYILSLNCHCDVMQVDSIKSYYYSTQILSVGWLHHIDVFKFKVQVRALYSPPLPKGYPFWQDLCMPNCQK